VSSVRRRVREPVELRVEPSRTSASARAAAVGRRERAERSHSSGRAPPQPAIARRALGSSAPVVIRSRIGHRSRYGANAAARRCRRRGCRTARACEGASRSTARTANCSGRRRARRRAQLPEGAWMRDEQRRSRRRRMSGRRAPDRAAADGQRATGGVTVASITESEPRWIHPRAHQLEVGLRVLVCSDFGSYRCDASHRQLGVGQVGAGEAQGSRHGSSARRGWFAHASCSSGRRGGSSSARTPASSSASSERAGLGGWRPPSADRSSPTRRATAARWICAAELATSSARPAMVARKAPVDRSSSPSRARRRRRRRREPRGSCWRPASSWSASGQASPR